MTDRDTANGLELSPQTEDRRGFLRRAGSWFMGLGLLSGYGAIAAFIGRFLLPTRKTPKAWQFVTTLAETPSGQSLTYLSPAGEKVVVARVAQHGDADDFIALSSVCPHLGCQVHWEQQNNRFFCPCHNGVFNPQGTAVEGPPADAGQSLARYPLMVENGMLFIEVQTEALVRKG
jgi:Rieske Fe-S protein